MKSFVPLLLLVVASTWGIHVDSDESELGVGLFNDVKDEDVETITPDIIKTKATAFLEKNKKIVTRLLTNALNKEIMDAKNWDKWEEMVQGEANDVVIKEGELEAFTKQLKKTGDETAQQITLKTIIEYFTPIAEKLAKDPGVKHTLPQQE